MLLPIKDSVGGAMGYKVFEELERYLKESEWCYYESNSGILDILSNYKRNLNAYLQNKDVLKVVSEKSNAGSLIKVEVINQVSGVDVKIRVIGQNGEDVYFKEDTRLNTDDYTVIAQTVKNWLDIYEKNIPYDGLVIGVLGDQFTTDVGKSYGAVSDSMVKVVRPTKKKRHPLLKEIVDWETTKLADGKLFHVAETQAQGNVTKYESKKRVNLDDWILIDKSQKIKTKDEINFTELDDYQFGKHGNIGLYAILGTGSDTITSTSTKKIGGMLFGVDLTGEVWLTRTYWASLEIGRRFGSYSKKEGTLQSDSNSLSGSKFKLKAGYKYLPLGFFYGPQVDGFVGYASYGYGFDTSQADGITGVNFSGLMLGAKGSIPLHKLFRLSLLLDFIFNPGFSEDIAVKGSASSTSNYHVEIGGSYQYNPSMTFDGGVGYTSNKAEFKATTSSLSVKETSIRAGATFTF
ncbi:MAG: hypothetical protein KC493_15345 [Bacteriovoracaceae bacterium]|nr:hypothetical protein [Bacteriovoracaceae bacterium]